MADRIRLPAGAQTPRLARRFVGERLRSWGYGDILAAVELLTSEIVTGAVLTADGPVIVEVGDLDDGVVVVVEDPARALPAHPTSGPLDRGGRGSKILDGVAASWGTAPVRHHGRLVWFRLTRA